jgi:hypothetical protein
MYIMAPEPTSTVNFINLSHQSVCLYVYPFFIAKQRLGVNVTAALNTYATMAELFDASFSMQYVLDERKLRD